MGREVPEKCEMLGVARLILVIRAITILCSWRLHLQRSTVPPNCFAPWAIRRGFAFWSFSKMANAA